MSNRLQKRGTHKSIQRMLNKAHGYVLLVLQKDGDLNCISSAGRLNDKEDVRHQFLHAVRKDAMVKVEEINTKYEKGDAVREQSKLVEAVKAARSAKLQAVEDPDDGKESADKPAGGDARAT